MSNEPRKTRSQMGLNDAGSAESQQKAGSEDQKSSDTGVSGKGGDTNNQKQAGKQVQTQTKDKPVPTREMISQGLKELVMEHRKGLQNMYGTTEAELDQNLKVQIDRGVEMARKLVIDMECGPEVAKDLTALTLYDVAILIDDSDSMISEDDGERKDTLIQFVDHVTEIYSLANESGLFAMRFMNRGGGKKNWKEKSQDYLNHHTYGGVTRIGTELKKKLLDKFAIGNSKQSKPLLVLIVTDGAVEGEKKGHLKNVIRDCVNERKRAGKGFEAVTFQFSRIGNDPGAAQLLIDLDKDPDLGEFIDVLPVEFNPSLDSAEDDKWWVLPKILLGAILPKWDAQDYYDYAEEENQLTSKPGNPDGNDSGEDWDD